MQFARLSFVVALAVGKVAFSVGASAQEVPGSKKPSLGIANSSIVASSAISMTYETGRRLDVGLRLVASDERFHVNASCPIIFADADLDLYSYTISSDSK